MQARAVLEDVPVAAFKLGFCGSVENVAVIAEILADYPDVPLVVEPGLHAAALVLGEAGEEIAAALADLILPQTTLLVADRHESLRLTGLAGTRRAESDEDDGGGEARARRVAPSSTRRSSARSATVPNTCCSPAAATMVPQLVDTSSAARHRAHRRRPRPAAARPGAWHYPRRRRGGSDNARRMALPEAAARGAGVYLPGLRHAYRAAPMVGRLTASFWRAAGARAMTERSLARTLRGLYGHPDEPDTGRLLAFRSPCSPVIRALQYRNRAPTPVCAASRRWRCATPAGCRRCPFIVNDDLACSRSPSTPTGASRPRGRPARRGALRSAAAHPRPHPLCRLVARDRGAEVGADYIAFGAMFLHHQAHAPPAPFALVERARRELGLPVAAIGGITLGVRRR